MSKPLCEVCGAYKGKPHRRDCPLGVPLAAALEAEREKQGLSVNALAKKAGLSPGRVHGILTGDTPNPGILTVQAITRALGRSLGWLERQIRAGDKDR